MRGSSRVFEVLALCLGNAIGGGSSAAVPLWVGAIVSGGTLPATQVGWLASGQSACIAISVFALAGLGKRLKPRWVVVLAAAMTVLSNLISMSSAFGLLIIGRLLSGLAAGALLATVTRVAARRHKAQRVLALMEGSTVLLVSLVYWTSPRLIDRYGVAALFALLAGAAVLLAFAALTRFPSESPAPEEPRRTATGLTLAPIVGSLALAVACVGQSMGSTYIVVIGTGLGLNSGTMATVLAISFPIVMLGPISAYLLGERFGLLRPLLIGFTLLAIDLLVLAHATVPLLFCLCAAGLNLWLTFCGPYAIALLGRLDLSGRFAGATPAIVMMGAAVGAALGSRLIGGPSFQPLSVIGASIIATAIALFVFAAYLDAKVAE